MIRKSKIIDSLKTVFILNGIIRKGTDKRKFSKGVVLLTILEIDFIRLKFVLQYNYKNLELCRTSLHYSGFKT